MGMGNETVHWSRWVTSITGNMHQEQQWVVYILRCADDTLYTGCTNALNERLAKHNAGTGAKYTRGRGPVQLVYSEQQKDRSEALQREAAIKKLSRIQKKLLILRH